MDFNSAWQVSGHMISIIIVTLFLIVSFFIIFKKVLSNPDHTKAPGYFQSLLENFILGFNNYLDGLTGGKMRTFYPYFITVYIFILFCATSDLIGMAPGAANLGFTLTLGFVTFIGIYVAGIVGHGLIGFIKEKYKNPLELITQFSPFISLSLRLFGSTFAMVILAKAIPEMFSNFFTPTFMDYIFPWFTIIYSWGLTGFASAMSLIQALVFVTLTVVYWGNELGEPAERKRKIREQKDLKRKLRIERIKEIKSTKEKKESK